MLRFVDQLKMYFLHKNRNITKKDIIWYRYIYNSSIFYFKICESRIHRNYERYRDKTNYRKIMRTTQQEYHRSFP